MTAPEAKEYVLETCWRDYKVDEVYTIDRKQPVMWRLLSVGEQKVLLMALDREGTDETWEVNKEAWQYYLRMGYACYFGYYENHGFMPKRFDPNHVERLHYDC